MKIIIQTGVSSVYAVFHVFPISTFSPLIPLFISCSPLLSPFAPCHSRPFPIFFLSFIIDFYNNNSSAGRNGRTATSFRDGTRKRSTNRIAIRYNFILHRVYILAVKFINIRNPTTFAVLRVCFKILPTTRYGYEDNLKVVLLFTILTRVWFNASSSAPHFGISITVTLFVVIYDAYVSQGKGKSFQCRSFFANQY